MKTPTLPEGEEDDGLDGEELESGSVGAQQLSGGGVEEEEGVERQADRDVVDDGDVQVTAGNAAARRQEWDQTQIRGLRRAGLPPDSLQVSVSVSAAGLQQHGDGGHQRLHHAELQRGLLTEPQEPDGERAAAQAAGTVATAGPGDDQQLLLVTGNMKTSNWNINTSFNQKHSKFLILYIYENCRT